jgi:hypothetical protein
MLASLSLEHILLGAHFFTRVIQRVKLRISGASSLLTRWQKKRPIKDTCTIPPLAASKFSAFLLHSRNSPCTLPALDGPDKTAISRDLPLENAVNHGSEGRCIGRRPVEAS